MDATHPLYTAVDRIMARGNPSPAQLKRLLNLFHRYELPVPLDVAAALMGESGYILGH